uniref:UBZ4-type domain-containing protein n=1 Tax=Bionectria ochroleuca TaxID=29856 RepID=A0A0B7K1L4_BIOOC
MEVACPICNKPVKQQDINSHLDSDCTKFVVEKGSSPPEHSQNSSSQTAQKRKPSSFFSTPAPKRQNADGKALTPLVNGTIQAFTSKKRTYDEGPGSTSPTPGPAPGAKSQAPAEVGDENAPRVKEEERTAKKSRTHKAAPLAERMRPQSLDEVCGQELVGPNGVLRSLIESNNVPSMILWGGSGTGKTTIARCIAHVVGSRFVELNATSTGVSECKKIFSEAANDLVLTGRKTIVFCDEIHRFNKSQQDVFLKPVEAGTVTLIGATTENPSFKVANALLSRCRTFTLKSLDTEDIVRILQRAIKMEEDSYPLTPLIDEEMVRYLARFSDGDARTALNLLELALSLTKSRQDITKEDIKASLTKTLMGCGAEYKYPPNYLDGKVSQTYLPDELLGRKFIEERDLGLEVDPDLKMEDA